jgi:hypothetical protein
VCFFGGGLLASHPLGATVAKPWRRREHGAGVSGDGGSEGMAWTVP